jgi:alkylation response protein AidB-like acyl-CoA dehydrogenase
MDFGWSKEQSELRAAAIEVGRGVSPGIRDRDRDGVFHRDGWNALAKFGAHGLPIPTEYGGMGFDSLTTVGVFEALGYACRDAGLLFSIHAHLWTLSAAILLFGTEAQKRAFLPGLCDGSRIGGNAMSEPGSGSDAFSLRTTATRKGDRWVLNGSKVFVSNAPVADVVLVFATVDPALGARGVSAFLVERDTPGFRVGRHLEKMGLRTSPMAELFFDDCEIPAENLLGKEGGGSNLFTQSLTLERAFILCTGVGAMQRLFESCRDYAKTRKQFGEPIGKFQLVSSKVIDMRIRLETARALLYKTAWLRDQGKSIFLEAAMSKLHISDAWVASAQDALQLHGGWGYMTEIEVEREVRDALGSKLHSGTSEIQRLIMAPLLGL